MPPGRVAYPVKLAWDWPKLMVTSTAVSAQTRRKALSASTCLKPARGSPAAGGPLAGRGRCGGGLGGGAQASEYGQEGKEGGSVGEIDGGKGGGTGDADDGGG